MDQDQGVDMKRTHGFGKSWEGDWEARVRARIRAQGYDSVFAFVAADPSAPLLVLAERLSEVDTDDDPHPVAADQLARLLRAEASEGGEVATEWMARRTLIGELQHYLPDGWRSTWTEENSSGASLAFAAWADTLDPGLNERALDILRALQHEARPPDGWLPEGVSDPILEAVFVRHWRDARLGGGRTPKPLRWVGNFRETGWDDEPSAPSLVECRGKRRNGHKDEVVRYLRAGKRLSASPGSVRDHFEPSRRAGSMSSLTDGVYVWPELLAYYVEQHDTLLPDDFEEHMQRNDWEVPDVIDVKMLRLP
jgi:hypothetical protein